MMPNVSSSAGGGEPVVRRVDEEDGSATLVIDFGASGIDVHSDVVGETLLVVRERSDGGEDTYEYELPAGQARTFMKNGVLTVEVGE